MKQFAWNILCVFGLLLAAHRADAQVYNAAVGLRLGYPLSVSYKKFISETSAVEVYGGFRGYRHYGWFSVNGAYLVHFPIEGINNLQWYVGGGAGVYFWRYDFDNDYGTTGFSIQGYLGLDFTFDEIPLSITADWTPVYIFHKRYDGFGGGYGGIGVRYVLNN